MGYPFTDLINIMSIKTNIAVVINVIELKYQTYILINLPTPVKHVTRLLLIKINSAVTVIIPKIYHYSRDLILLNVNAVLPIDQPLGFNVTFVTNINLLYPLILEIYVISYLITLINFRQRHLD